MCTPLVYKYLVLARNLSEELDGQNTDINKQKMDKVQQPII